jgi:cephalosporin-C deacetylase-like acetyl esterase
MKILIFAVLLAIPFFMMTAEADKGDSAVEMPDLSRGWKFMVGDNPGWSAPILDDAGWQPIEVGQAWERQGHQGYDGYGWYRLRFRLPTTLQALPDFKNYGKLNLKLGIIGDVNSVWLNGSLQGQTGVFPEPYSSEWRKQRQYTLPTDLLRWDEDNVLAVRVYNHEGQGGMFRGPYALELQSWKDHFQAEVDLGRGDGIFAEGDSLPIAVNVQNNTPLEARGDVTWTIDGDEFTTLKELKGTASIQSGNSQRIECDFSPEKPGFYKVTFDFKSTTNDMTATATSFIGFRPEEIQSPLTIQDDFDEFWKGTLAALKSVEPQFQMTHVQDRDTATHEVYEVEMRSLNNIHVRGWYEKPRGDGIFPALLRVPGYGGAMEPMKSAHAWAVLSFNPRAHGNSQDEVKGQPGDYWIRGLDDKEGYFYQGAFADCVRAVDFLASRPEIDVKRLAVTGGSQGGGLSMSTAALDKRISFCAPDIPFMLDYVRYFRTSKWPEMDDWIAAKDHRTWTSTLRTLGYFDLLNMADRIDCPVFMGMGLQDGTCPPATIFAVYNRLKGEKAYFVYPEAGHWVAEDHHVLRRNWLLEHLGVEK